MELSLIEKFSDPALFDSLTMGEKATGALITTFTGMGITFIVLVLLWAVIVIMSKTIGAVDKEKIQKNPENIEVNKPEKVQNSNVNDEELVAVILAAIVASEGNKNLSASNLVVRKIKKVSGNVWSNAGMADCVESRRVY